MVDGHPGAGWPLRDLVSRGISFVALLLKRGAQVGVGEEVSTGCFNAPGEEKTLTSRAGLNESLLLRHTIIP